MEGKILLGSSRGPGRTLFGLPLGRGSADRCVGQGDSKCMLKARAVAESEKTSVWHKYCKVRNCWYFQVLP